MALRNLHLATVVLQYEHIDEYRRAHLDQSGYEEVSELRRPDRCIDSSTLSAIEHLSIEPDVFTIWFAIPVQAVEQHISLIVSPMYADFSGLGPAYADGLR